MHDFSINVMIDLMRTFIYIGICVVLFGCKHHKEQTVFDQIFEDGSSLFQSVIDAKDVYEVQILFSPISRTSDSVKVIDHTFNYRPGEYFYPASSVKMPVAFMAMQKLEELRTNGIPIDRNTPLRIDSIRPLHRPVLFDDTSEGGKPTIGHFIEKVFAVSDNDAFNRLYEFCGSDYINGGLKAKGVFTNGRVVHRLGVKGFTFEENKFTPPIHFLDKNDEVIYSNINPATQGFHLTLVDNEQKGIAYINGNGDRIEERFDFREKNFVNINDLQESLKRLILPELYYPQQVYSIHEDDRAFLLETMEKTPGEHVFLKDKTDEFYDSYVKFLVFGDTKEPIPDHNSKTPVALIQ